MNTDALPQDVLDVFRCFVTAEYTVIDSRGYPITWPLVPFFSQGATTIDVTTGLGYPKKADDAKKNPRVSLLFSEPKGSSLDQPPMVLVTGTAVVDDGDLDRNRVRYRRESAQKIPGLPTNRVPAALQRFASWYFTRIYIHVDPRSVIVWPAGNPAVEPLIFGDPPPATAPEPPAPGDTPGTASGLTSPERLDDLGSRFPTAAVSWVGADGYPLAVRVGVDREPGTDRVRLTSQPAGLTLAQGPACLTAHDHGERLRWQINFQVRGDLVREESAWFLVPRRLVGGFEAPAALHRLLIQNARKMRRFRKTAKLRLRSAIDLQHGS